jgi:hypothetical protein
METANFQRHRTLSSAAGGITYGALPYFFPKIFVPL